MVDYVDYMVMMDALAGMTGNSGASIKNQNTCRRDTARRIFGGVLLDRQEPHSAWAFLTAL